MVMKLSFYRKKATTWLTLKWLLLVWQNIAAYNWQKTNNIANLLSNQVYNQSETPSTDVI